MDSSTILYSDFIAALSIWGAFFLLGFLLDRLLFSWVDKPARKGAYLSRAFLFNLKGKATSISFFLGFYVGVLYAPLPERVEYYSAKAALVLLIIMIAVVLSRTFVSTVRNIDLGQSNTFKTSSIITNIIRLLIFIIAFLFVLEAIGVSITPLLTALGVGALAVALALQDTLGNLFAGINVIAGKRIRPGDYIKLDLGQEGYIEDISWRSTLIREINNNCIIVPNQKIASAIVLNYSLADKNLIIKIPVTVGYNSDLLHVEQVTIEEAQKIQNQFSEAEEVYVPSVRFTAFGETGVAFTIQMRCREYSEQSQMTDMILRALHLRYQQEHIEIPVRRERP